MGNKGRERNWNLRAGFKGGEKGLFLEEKIPARREEMETGVMFPRRGLGNSFDIKKKTRKEKNFLWR